MVYSNDNNSVNNPEVERRYEGNGKANRKKD